LAFVLYLALAEAGLAAPGLTLVPQSSSWHYFDRGAPPSGWNLLSFDHASWPSGLAEFGYGEGDENTPISRGPDPLRPYVSAYFRKWFEVPADISAYDRLQLGVLRDDGAIVYLNDVEIYRSNMPTGAVAFTNYAVTNVGGGSERVYYATNLDPSLLQLGTTNLLAVQVHQASLSSDDLSFNLRLFLTNAAPEIVRGPYLQSGSSTGVVVRWRTSKPTDSRVRWGPATNDLSSEASSTEITTEHALAITGLSPDQRYYYSVGDSSAAMAGGADFSFVTVPTSARPFRIWAIGDAGTATSSQRAVRDAYDAFAANQHTDVWLMLGDNAYNVGTDAEYQQAVFNMYPKMLRNTLLYPALGNHETYHTGNPQDIDYLRIFSLPANADAGGIPSGTELYYSFDYANAHFVCLDSMISDRSSNGAMYAWLEQDLAATTKDWLIAFWHHPPYTKGSHDSDWEFELIEMRENILPLLESHGVDLVLCGHSHSYERSFMVHGHYGLSESLTPAMILDGGSGRDDGTGSYTKRGAQGAVYVVAGSSGQTSGGTLDHPVMYVSLNELGSLVIDVNDKRLDARFLRENGAIDDYFTLTKAALQIVSVTTSNGVITIGWNSTPGATYRMWRADSLEEPVNWVPILPLVPSTGSYSSWLDSIVPERPTAFYRVSTLP
jgi:hypothetical protein